MTPEQLEALINFIRAAAWRAAAEFAGDEGLSDKREEKVLREVFKDDSSK